MYRKILFRAIVMCGLALLVPATVSAQGYEVTVDSPLYSMGFTASIPGESQSTVVPPGLKSQCSQGRFIVTNDARRPTDGNSVVWRDLNSSAATYSATTFDTVPIDNTKIAFLTNDHDIITMPNGDLVLVWGMHFATPLNPKPGWFDITFKGNFGPGVRRGVMAWRSTDCGQSFQYMGQVDPATTDDGSCALPQWRRDANGDFIKTTPYGNGGVDGQLIKLDPATNKIYLMFQCVGQLQDKTKSTWTLSGTRLNKTMVLSSGDEGATWKMLGWLNTATWRFGVVPMSQDRLAFAASNIISFGHKLANGDYQFDSSGTPTPAGQWGWDNFDTTTVKTLVSANLFGHTIITRVPDNKNGIFMAFPDTFQINGKPANGFRLFFFDRSKNQFAEADPVLPSGRNDDSFAMHLTAIDLGSGPIILYWYDMNVAGKRGTVRGRLITGMGEFSDDFPIYKNTARLQVGAVNSVSAVNNRLVLAGDYFDLGSNSYWYGDYKTAGGYVSPTRLRAQQPGRQSVLTVLPQKYNYFPMWIEPDKTIRYAQVSVEALPSRKSLHINYTAIPKWRPAPPPVELLQRKITPAELRDIKQYAAP